MPFPPSLPNSGLWYENIHNLEGLHDASEEHWSSETRVLVDLMICVVDVWCLPIQRKRRKMWWREPSRLLHSTVKRSAWYISQVCCFCVLQNHLYECHSELNPFYRKTSNKCQIRNKRGISHRRQDSQNTCKANTQTYSTILRNTKCTDLTPLSTLVDNDKRINISIRYTWYHNMYYVVYVLTNARVVY